MRVSGVGRLLEQQVMMRGRRGRNEQVMVRGGRHRDQEEALVGGPRRPEVPQVLVRRGHGDREEMMPCRKGGHVQKEMLMRARGSFPLQ